MYYAFCETSFIPKGQRVELFELTDNEIPVFKISLSEDEFLSLEQKASLLNSPQIAIINYWIKGITEVINRKNFNVTFLGYDFNLDMLYEPSKRLNDFSISPIIRKLIIKDDRRFREILKEIVSDVFNPAVLYSHIDELKSFI